jgi:molybdopterin molybdotransferase
MLDIGKFYNQMISFEEAYRLVMDKVTLFPAERVNMTDSLGRILAENIFSDVDMPPFDKSAVDGFACRKDDLDVELEVVETIPAGKTPEANISEGKCSRIMTGAMLPVGSDCVIMVEDSHTLDNGKVKITRKQDSHNICFQGEDIKAGDKVLSTGTLLKPQHIAVLATAGAVSPKVSKQLHIGILSTGDELVEPEHLPSPSKIRNTNAYQLMAQVSEAGAIPQYGGIASDTEASLTVMLSDLLDQNDIVLLTGGVSMGDFDYVPKVMESLGIEILFNKVAIQPGKPTVFGRRGSQFVFGLPGNPVSSFVLFEVLVKPFLLKMMGYQEVPAIFRLPLGTDFKRKKSERKMFLPVNIENGLVIPLEYHGSAHINAYTKAKAMIVIDIGVTGLKKGEMTDVRFL